MNAFNIENSRLVNKSQNELALTSKIFNSPNGNQTARVIEKKVNTTS